MVHRLIDATELHCGEYLGFFACRTCEGIQLYLQRGTLADLLVGNGFGIRLEEGLPAVQVRAWYYALVTLLGKEDDLEAAA